MTAAEILAIPLSAPEKLFTGDADRAREEFRLLAKEWHPDTNPGKDPSVFGHISALYDLAVEKFRSGSWGARNLLKIVDRGGREFRLSYLRAFAHEAGEAFIGRRVVAWSFPRELDDIVEAGVRMIRDFRFNDSEMRAEHTRYLPKLAEHLQCEDRSVLVFEKPAEHVLLRHVMDKVGRIDPKQAAWIISSLLNIRAYLEWAGISHNAISPDTYFVSPKDHSGSLIGGWWFSSRIGQKPLAWSARAWGLARWGKPGAVDGELIRATGREMLGSPSGMDLACPDAMAQWLRYPAGESGYQEYDDWLNKVLKAAFGARRFVKWDFDHQALYD